MQAKLTLTAPIVHRTDPLSSFQAAEKKDRSGTRVKHAEIVLGLVKLRPGRTAAELAAGTGAICVDDTRRLMEVRRRLSDLKEDEYIRRGEARRCTVLGSNTATWWPL